VFILPEPSKINHLVIFTTGIPWSSVYSSSRLTIEPFQEKYGASIYYNTAKQQAVGAAWQFLGILANEKPSAIFRVQQPNCIDQDMENDTVASGEDYGEIGISIEPMPVLETLMSEKAMAVVPASSQPSASNDTRGFLQKIAENAYNYLSSFSKPASEFGQEQVVPIRALQDWFNTAMRKIASDPQFSFK